MQFKALLKKEILVMLSNHLAIFANIVIPVVIICISLFYTNMSDIYINIGCNGDIDDITLFEQSLNQLNDNVTFHMHSYSDKQQMEDDFYNKKINLFFVGDTEIEIYYNNIDNKSQIAYQYFISALQKLNSQNYSPEMLAQIMDMQTYTVSSVVIKAIEGGDAIDSFVWSGFIWILIYSNFSVSISQMQQERNTKTILYLHKSGANTFNIFSSKILAGLIQFVMSISVYISVTHGLGLLNYQFKNIHVILFLLVAITIIALGHLLGTVIKNSSVLVILQMLIVFPLMLMNSLQTSSLDTILKYNPVYCGALLAQGAMSGGEQNIINIVVCVATIIICYVILKLYLEKSEPVKLCKMC